MDKKDREEIKEINSKINRTSNKWSVVIYGEGMQINQYSMYITERTTTKYSYLLNSWMINLDMLKYIDFNKEQLQSLIDEIDDLKSYIEEKTKESFTIMDKMEKEIRKKPQFFTASSILNAIKDAQ